MSDVIETVQQLEELSEGTNVSVISARSPYTLWQRGPDRWMRPLTGDPGQPDPQRQIPVDLFTGYIEQRVVRTYEVRDPLPGDLFEPLRRGSRNRSDTYLITHLLPNGLLRGQHYYNGSVMETAREWRRDSFTNPQAMQRVDRLPERNLTSEVVTDFTMQMSTILNRLRDQIANANSDPAAAEKPDAPPMEVRVRINGVARVEDRFAAMGAGLPAGAQVTERPEVEFRFEYAYSVSDSGSCACESYDEARARRLLPPDTVDWEALVSCKYNNDNTITYSGEAQVSEPQEVF